jgi:hypothetical protein
MPTFNQELAMDTTHTSNPFEQLLDPNMIARAMEASERLGRHLHSRVCRPLDRPVIPTTNIDDPVAAFDAAIERASARRY